MRQSYLKNAALLTVSDVGLRLAGMGLRIYLANALGGEGMGLYQLVLAVYSLFVTLATSGVSVASTRLMAEELTGSPARAKGMLLRLCGMAAALGGAAMGAQWILAEPAARWWLGDARAAAALRAGAFGMPFMAVAAVLRGFFVARQQVGPNVASQAAEQLFRMGVMVAALELTQGQDVGVRCAWVMAATAGGEMVSAGLMALFARREGTAAFGHDRSRAPLHAGRRIWEILWPVQGGRCLSSALHTAENMLAPACLTAYLGGQRSVAVTQYGCLKGMALPLMNFPFGLLGSLGVLLMPEITRAHIRADRVRLEALLRRMLRLTMYMSALVGAVFWVWGRPLTEALYGSAEAGGYLEILAPAMPLLYLESMVDGAMKGIGEQKAVFRYSVWDSILRIAGVMVLLPRWGMKGFLFVILLSSLFTCVSNTLHLVKAASIRPDWLGWLAGPAFAAGLAGLAGWGVRQGLTAWLAGGRVTQLAAVCAGAAVMTAVCLGAGWPLGLSEEVRAIWESRRQKPKVLDTGL